MPNTLICPACGKRYDVPAEYLRDNAGLETDCTCGQPIPIPILIPSPPPQPPPGGGSANALTLRSRIRRALKHKIGSTLPPRVWRTLKWQIYVTILMGLISSLGMYDLLTNPKSQHRPDIVPFCCFMGVIGYFSLAAAASALLIWRRKRIGLYIGWTVLPGIVWTAPGLLSQEMRDYLAG